MATGTRGQPETPCNLAHFQKTQVFLIFGKSGWIGGLVGDLLKQQGANFQFANARLEDRSGVIAELERVCVLPGSVVCRVCVTVQPLGDVCESLDGITNSSCGERPCAVAEGLRSSTRFFNTGEAHPCAQRRGRNRAPQCGLVRDPQGG